MKKLLLMFVLAILSACSTQMESFHTYNEFQTNVVLSEANFVVIRNVEASTSRCFNSGIARNAAIEELFKKANLKGSQVIANITVSQSEGTFCDRAKAFGTVIEFIDSDKGKKPNSTAKVNNESSACDKAVWGDACGD